MDLIINKQIDGYAYVDIHELEYETLSNYDKVALIVNETNEEESKKYYKAIRNILLYKSKVYLIIVENGKNIEQECINLMLIYRNCNIYKVDDINFIDYDYIQSIFDREASFTEVQAYLGYDTTSYGDIVELVGKIQSLIEEKNIDELEEFIARNLKAIRDMPNVISYLIRIVEEYNGKDLLTELNKMGQNIENLNYKLSLAEEEENRLKAEIDKKKDDINSKNIEILELKNNMELLHLDIKAKQIEMDNLDGSGRENAEKLNKVIIELNDLQNKYADKDKELAEQLKKVNSLENLLKNKEYELEKLANLDRSISKDNDIVTELESALDNSKHIITELESKLNNANIQIESLRGSMGNDTSGDIIKNYSELNTSLVNCKIDNIVYFKEISYVTYTNSLIKSLIEFCKLNKKKVKLLIYDNGNIMSSTYNPLNIVNSNEYIRNKERLVKDVESFVITEPNQAIINDIVTCSDVKYDILIVYDRMKQLNNVINGNNVFNFWVANSSNDVKNLEQRLKINDKSRLIVGLGYHEKDQSLKIPTVNGYNEKTESAKNSAYFTLKYNGVSVIRTILEKARIDIKRR